MSESERIPGGNLKQPCGVCDEHKICLDCHGAMQSAVGAWRQRAESPVYQEGVAEAQPIFQP